MTDRAFPPVEGVRHTFVTVPNGLRTHVAEAGPVNAPPVLLVHGWPQHWWEWRGLMPALARNYRVIAPDLRGFGWTDAPATGYDRVHFVGDLVGLLDGLGVDRVRMVAHDMGAVVGFHLCLDQPERVSDYVSLSIPHLVYRPTPAAMVEGWRMWYQVPTTLPGLGPRLLSGGQQRLLRHVFTSFAGEADTSDEVDLEEYLAPMRESARARAARACYLHYIWPSLGAMVRGAYRGTRLTTPTLLLIGSEDRAVRAEHQGGHEDWADDLVVDTVDGASHWLPEEQPGLLAEKVLHRFAVSRR
ncbi:MAG TPA: alpha/beta fold hydrolase [Pedococcus sp.]|nr:alpha/beta fold hydrolase [Pedococcus sp.]